MAWRATSPMEERRRLCQLNLGRPKRDAQSDLQLEPLSEFD